MISAVLGNFGGQIAVLAISIADRVLLVGLLLRAWGADGYSDWTSIVSAAGMLSMFEFSLNIYFGNRWRALFAQGDEAGFARLIGVSIAVYATLGCVLLAAAEALAWHADVRQSFGLVTLNAATARLVAMPLVAGQVLQIARGSISQIYRGRGDYARGLVINSFIAAANILAMMAAVASGAKPAQAGCVSLMVNGIGGLAFITFDLRRQYPGLRMRPCMPGLAELRALAGAGRWLAIVQSVSVALLQGPVLVLGALKFGGAGLAGFVLMRTLVNLGRTLVGMVATAVGVEVSGAVAAQGWQRADQPMRVSGRFISGMSGVIVAGIWTFGAQVVRLWSGKDGLFEPLTLALMLLPPALIAAALPLGSALLMANELRILRAGATRAIGARWRNRHGSDARDGRGGHGARASEW